MALKGHRVKRRRYNETQTLFRAALLSILNAGVDDYSYVYIDDSGVTLDGGFDAPELVAAIKVLTRDGLIRAQYPHRLHATRHAVEGDRG